jgi:hypothetical protein
MSRPFGQYIGLLSRLENAEKALDEARTKLVPEISDYDENREADSIEYIIKAIAEITQGLKDQEMRRVRS